MEQLQMAHLVWLVLAAVEVGLVISQLSEPTPKETSPAGPKVFSLTDARGIKPYVKTKEQCAAVKAVLVYLGYENRVAAEAKESVMVHASYANGHKKDISRIKSDIASLKKQIEVKKDIVNLKERIKGGQKCETNDRKRAAEMKNLAQKWT